MSGPCPCLSLAGKYGILAGQWAAMAALWSGMPEATFYTCCPALHLFNEAWLAGYRPITEEEFQTGNTPITRGGSMPFIVKEEKKEFSKAPEGLHEAVCSRIVDLGMQQTAYGPKHLIKLYWQIGEKEPETGRQFTVGRRYTLSFASKAKLRGDLEIWRGRKFTPEELQGFDLERLLGKPCQIQIAHNFGNDGETWANVQAVVPAAKGSVALKVGEDWMGVPPGKVELTGTGNGEPSKPTTEDDDEIPF